MLSKIKAIIAKLICNDTTGKIIGFFLKNKIGYFNKITVLTDSPYITPYIKSMLFWGLYESAEAKSVLKYIDDKHDIIELGGSIGVISSLVGKFKGSRKIICVEVNSDLVPVIEKNLNHNKVTNYTIKNIAIGDDSADLWFTPGAHSTHGQVGERLSNDSIKIPMTTLSELVTSEKISQYNLICDIEGSEIDIILSDPNSLKNCQTLIIETHEVTRNGRTFQATDMKDMILKLGFICKEEYGVNFVFTRK
jgi:FkbM family methyltransferase